MSTSIRIGISGSYGGLNLGDEAILECIVLQIRQSIDAHITVYSRRPEDTEQRHTIDRAVDLEGLTRDEARREIEQLDLFILGGGGILYDADIEVYLRGVALAHEAGVPVMVYAVSAGPLEEESSRALVRDHLSGAAALTVRDSIGKKILEEIGIEREIQVTADPALLLRPQPVTDEDLVREGLDPEKRLIGFSVREPGPAAPDMDVDHYHALLANAADFLVDRLQAHIIFVPMEKKKLDVQHSHAVVAQMKCAEHASVLRGDYSPGQLISLIERMEFAVGMRLHFLIFSALARVPFVALPYSGKVMGLLEDLDMEMPPLKHVNTGRLIASIDRSWDMRERIRDRLSESLPPLQQRARRTHHVLQELAAGIATES